VEQARTLVEEASQKTVEAEGRAVEAQADAVSQNADLKADLQEAEIRVYKLEKVVGLPNGRELIGLMESVKDKAVVDQLVEKRGAVQIGDPNLRAVHEAVRATKGKIADAHQLDESVPSSTPSPIEEFGADDIAHMRSLAGYTPDGG